jgi:hypothetical protein
LSRSQATSAASADATFENGVRGGDGLVILSYTLPDTSAPVASPNQAPAANSAGWNNADVTVSWNWSDGGSGIDPAHCTASSTSSGEGTLTLSATCADLAGNVSNTSYTVKVDTTAPTVSVTGVTNGATYTLGAVPTAGCSTTDALSGVATAATLSMSGSGVGVITASCAGATDNAGNSASASVSYTVSYAFSGFLDPVDNPPVVNVAKAGSAIPLSWRLTDASGNPITTLTSVTVTSAAGGCSASTPTDALESYAAGASGLQNLGNGYY